MPENILVVEYEPRYTDRVKQALAGQPFVPSFARDGEEAIRALDGASPSLIVLSSVVPKISTAELIRAIRERKTLADTPILLTVSGYNGRSPKSDAVRLGASDILPKPYSETEFLGKVQQMLGLDQDATMRTWVPELNPGFTVRTNPAADKAQGQLTSDDIFGELLDDKAAAQPGATKKMKPTDDLDKLLEDTLSGVRPQKKRDTVSTPAPTPPPAPAPAPAAPKPRSSTADANLDKLVSDTLSGLDRTVRAKPAAPKPAPTPAPAPQPATTEKIKIATPVFPAAPPAAAPKEEEEPTDGIRFGQYVLIEKIATGGMAEVWKARMRGVEGFQKIVAIKKILPHLSDNQDFVEMFVDEAKLAAQLNHNNIIHIYDLGKIQSSYYIAMEYIDGHDLKTILRRGAEHDQPMTVELALFIASKIASALDYAHRKRDFEDREMGLVHRDVSPQNVLISQEGDIKLCDFGIAKAASKASHTQVGALKGKLQYMSPEQAQGQKVDRRSDIFALATVLFEMLTNRKLFAGDNELSILEQVREAHVKPPSEFNEEVTPEIDAIVLKALQKDPAGRYQTAGEMAKDLDAVLYSFKPTPTSADLAIYMHRIWSEEPVVHAPMPEPVVEAKPEPAPVPVPIAVPAPTPTPAPSFGYEEPPAKKFPFVPAGIAAAIVVAILAVWLATRGGGKKTTSAATQTTQTIAATATTAGTTASPTPSTTAVPPPSTTAAPTTATSLDQSKIDQEVQKRLAAEKARLDAQTKAQQPATQPPVAAAPSPRPATATTPPQPQPQVVEQRPAPTPQTPAPQPQPAVVQPQPAVPVPQPEVARAKTGELIEPGTEGLTPPRVTSRAAPIYPQIARIQRVQGNVIISALISENGQVIDTKIIRGVPRGGLNEAAEQSVRHSTYAPATKDGVRVKSWLTIEVNFKL